MKRKLKTIIISFILMIITYFIIILSNYYFDIGLFAPHVGLLFVLGMLLGPYGSLGAVIANTLMDFYSELSIIEIIPSQIVSFGISYLAYKLWYTSFRGHEITKPKLDNIYHISLFVGILFLCGFIYSILHGAFFNILDHSFNGLYIGAIYFFNLINIGFISGIIAIILSKRIDFINVPKTSERKPHVRLYQALFALMILILIILTILQLSSADETTLMIPTIVFIIVFFAYLTKPFTGKISQKDNITLIEKIIKTFLLLTLIIAILGVLLNIAYGGNIFDQPDINVILIMVGPLILTDIIIILFFIPGFFTVRYVEKNVTNPISAFSEIEEFINENERIEAEGLLKIYSEYLDNDDEIGMLARSYTNLIKHNNDYIDNIREIESDKERIKAELDIATKIQASNLPTKSLETDEYFVDGYSHPAKEVGGDFFDYYQLDDDNLVLVIGDASGKGVPAALLSTITQVMIKQLLQHDTNPSKILYSLNNQLCENNFETMFITVWLGIYNRNTNKITFSNAGHNPPLIKTDNGFEYMDMETGIVLGIFEDFEFCREEIDLQSELILYTDGITDANNDAEEMYGEERFLKFVNEHRTADNPIAPLLNDIKNFTEGKEQYDDMTIIYLKKK